MHQTVRKVLPVVIVAGLLGSVALLLRPRPVPVDVATVSRSPLTITVDDDGRTRIKERYTVSAPLTGRLARVTLREGDPVVAGQTLLAAIDPLDPSLLDPRTAAQAEARVQAAQASLERAAAALQAASASTELASTEYARLREAVERGAGNDLELQRAAAESLIRREAHRAAGFERDVAKFELEQAKAALVRTLQPASGDQSWRFEILSPVSGRVLRVFQESAGVVQPGTPLIEIGDPSDLELVVDVLSADAVAIRPGARVTIDHWGGERPLDGRVRLVEPSAFTKVSSLGVEEQRVNVVIDLLDPPQARSGLADGFRIEARIEVWSEPDVLTVPTSALFRHDRSWAVFVVSNGRASARDVGIGRRGPDLAQVESGVEAGEQVVVYPSDRVVGGVRVKPRAAGVSTTP